MATLGDHLITIFANARKRAEAGHNVTARVPKALIEAAQNDIEVVLHSQNASAEGLSEAEASNRLEKYGENQAVQEKHIGWFKRLILTFRNPLVVLLLVLAAISLATGDVRAATVMLLMVLLGVSLRYFQEMRADAAAAKLKAMISTTVTAVRDGKPKEIPLKQVVPGDILHLAAGDLVPADVRLVSSKDLFVNQTALTGEALPVEKHAPRLDRLPQNPIEITNVCFMGTNIESGTATAVAILTGGDTYFGSLAEDVVNVQGTTSFDQGINNVTWLMISFMAVMVPLVFLINGISKHNWLEAFLFAVAVAVGLTPEMLPMIVTVNLSKGALSMSRKKVIVKSLSAIQNFGAMDVLCTDKTGTLTQGRVILEKHLDPYGDESQTVLNYSYLNSYYQTGLKNMLDVAVLEHEEVHKELNVKETYRKIDEIPFDFVRRRMSVIVEDKQDNHYLICKGAVEEIMGLCTRVEARGEIVSLDPSHHQTAEALVRDLNEDGFRVVALAYKQIPAEDNRAYSVKDEADLTLLGFLAFLDPPKLTAMQAITELQQRGLQVKILTGDNEIVTRKICKQVGLPAEHILLGGELEGMADSQLAEQVEQTTVFAKLSPAHKERIIKALQQKSHVVGFMGDGINDAPALKAADTGISVDTAVDIAKESSDIILLENSLLVLQEGVLEGRRVFGNIIKYIKMAASSNFGNMFSVVGGSLFLPFLPMLPIQVLANNLLYDFSQTTIPTDEVDEEWLRQPRQWTVGEIRRFIIFIGPISSIFDYLTYFIMLYIFNCWNNPALFHTGWFVESLMTQTLIIHVIRTNKIPFVQSIASLPLILTSLAIVAIGVWLPVSPVAAGLGFVPLPPLYWLLVGLMLLTYVVLTQLVKVWFIKRYAEN
jgi:Mg2+-importing ATPase